MKKLFCLLAVLALLARPLRAEAAPQRYLALTFDDGPSGELTEQLLEGLAERQVHATFFVCAYRIAQFPDTLSHIAAAGHEIGLHSSNHDYMQKMDYETALSDLTRCAKAVEDACGVQARLFRPPGGLYGDTLLSAAKDAGLSVILWSVDPCDWNEAAWDGVLPTVLSEAHDGRIILMHDLSAHSVTCALQAIDRLQARGYTFCTVSELAALRGTALLPAGKPRRGQHQLGIRKAKGTQLTLGILRRQAVAGQRQVGGGGQLRAEAILLKDGGGRFDAGHCAGVRGLQSQQDAQQRGLAAAGAAHQHPGAVHRPGKALQNRRTAEAFAEIGYHNAHTRTSPQRRVLAVRSRAAAAADSAADNSTMTSVHANTSGVDRVIFAR